VAITVESTTAPQYELNHAVSEDRKNPEALDKFKEQEEKATPGARTDAEKTPVSGTDDHKEPEGKKEAEDDLQVGARKRIDKLTARAKTAEETVAELRTRLEALEKGKEQPKTDTKQPQAATERPKRADFLAQGKSDEEYEDALFAWRAVEDERKALTAEIEDRTKEIVSTHNERMTAAKEKYHDFEDKLKTTTIPWDAKNPQDVQASKAFQVAIHECDNGPDVLYEIAQKPELAAQFAGLSPARTQLLIGRISASLLPSETPEKKEPPKTRVAAPPKPVGGSANTSAYDPYKEQPKNHKQYMAWRKTQGQGRAN